MARGVQVEDLKVCVVMVGLPARGKSYIARKAQRYLQWLSIPAKTFNVGTYRRKDAAQPTADFFDTNNAEGERKRRAAAEAAVRDMLSWLKNGGVVGILDATNSTKARRRWVLDQCTAAGVEVLFVESKCDDEDLIMANIRDVKTTSPDYKGQDPEQAALDFRNRIRNYEKVYTTIDGDGDEDELTYLKIIDTGSRVIISRIQDYLQSRIVYYLMNVHIRPRSVWLSRHGESMYNLDGRIGGDADLSPRGQQYALKLPELVRRSVGDDRPLTVWTSTLKRTIATARHLPKDYNQLQWKALDELDSGVCDGYTYQQIKDEYPDDFRARDEDKYNYRYRGGESYRDVVTRLEPIIMELERSQDILIITHQAVIRCIYAYFMEKDQTRSPWMNVPLHTLIKLTPRAYGTEEVRYTTDIEAEKEGGQETVDNEGNEAETQWPAEAVHCHNDVSPRSLLLRRTETTAPAAGSNAGTSTSSISAWYGLVGIINWETAGFYAPASELGLQDTYLGTSNRLVSFPLLMREELVTQAALQKTPAQKTLLERFHDRLRLSRHTNPFVGWTAYPTMSKPEMDELEDAAIADILG